MTGDASGPYSTAKKEAQAEYKKNTPKARLSFPPIYVQAQSEAYKHTMTLKCVIFVLSVRTVNRSVYIMADGITRNAVLSSAAATERGRSGLELRHNVSASTYLKHAEDESI